MKKSMKLWVGLVLFGVSLTLFAASCGPSPEDVAIANGVVNDFADCLAELRDRYTAGLFTGSTYVDCVETHLGGEPGQTGFSKMIHGDGPYNGGQRAVNQAVLDLASTYEPRFDAAIDANDSEALVLALTSHITALRLIASE